MDGQMVDGRMDRWLDERMDRGMDGWMELGNKKSHTHLYQILLILFTDK